VASGFNKLSLTTYKQPFGRVSYGMLIDADSNTKTGYNGADDDLYVEAVGGKVFVLGCSLIA
jgi:hypothetical protein